MFFKNKAKRWLSKAQASEIPLSLPNDNRGAIARFLREKIEADEVYGIVSPDDSIFFPDKYIERSMANQLQTEGFIDICTLIDQTQGKLPGRILELKILAHVQEKDGFLDIIFRRFFTLQGAENFLKQYLEGKPMIQLKTILNDIYWGEEYVEAILDLLAERDQFRGYIDPLNKRLYNFTHLKFASSVDWEKWSKQLIRYIKKSFQLGAEVAISDICGLTGFSLDESIHFLQKNRGGISFVISTDQRFIYPTLDIVIQILRDLMVYQNIPIAFWQQRLDVDNTELLSLLRILDRSLNGRLSSTVYEGPSLQDWLQNGIDIEGLAEELNLDSLLLLERVRTLGEKQGLRFIAGDSVNPFLIKGVSQFEIFCQIDTDHHSDPKLYHECQNCRRIMCSDCRTSGSKHSCPFCDNIAAFIIDLPRHCPDCGITFTHSYNLISTEECYFCKKGPLGTGWFVPSPMKTLPMNPKLSELLKQSESEIPLQRIISTLGWADAEVIAYLEEMVISKQVLGRISIAKTSLELKHQTTTFLCSVCETRKTNIERYRCVSCGESVCSPCYVDMAEVGMILCPQCSGELQLEESGAPHSSKV